MEMREVTDHLINSPDLKPAERGELQIWAQGSKGAGGANRDYLIEDPNGVVIARLIFQEGGIPENGINGVTNEALLAIVTDRLRSFQQGPFPCPQNAQALSFAVASLTQLLNRTKERLARGVEGREIA